ncbi:MAG: RecBCD enzyme subunit RecB [Catillopecten margaritatus gill symbiont]|uniref:DNA 3'-5' helicase n=1 Tax=Catillopecten margaritatus gill symbiont TaxID=3083288 RepID=A0AAU6PGK5_9GAMM
MVNDQAQREQALDILKSFIIQAPAGSGKTELLTQRYLKLLANCKDPESVIAMTFTNKAVDEMTHRVLSALKSTQNACPDEPHKKITYDLATAVIRRSDEQGWDLLQNPKRLKISTIDGLYSLITNRYPLPTQLVPRQIMAEQWERDGAYQTAARQTLLMIDDEDFGEAIADLLLHLDNNVGKFESLVMNMLSKRDQWLHRLYRDNVLDLQILQDSARAIILEHLVALHQLAEPCFSEEFFALLAVSQDEEFASLQSLPECGVANLEQWQVLANVCLTGSGGWRKSLTKANGFPTELKEQKDKLLKIIQGLEGNNALKVKLLGLENLPDVDFSQAQVDTLKAIAQVLKLCVAQLSLYFEDKQAHDFIEVALNANQALVDVSDIALFLDYKIQHLLIDEFQDTSASQFNTLSKLIEEWQVGDGKTLFLVGDPMQSIYRFRESQVGLFLQVRDEGIANIEPTSLVLDTNFRSSKSIVEGNNGFFSRIFPEFDDVYKGAISYSPSLANSKAEKEDAIVFYPFAHDQYLREANTISAIVRDTLARNTQGTIAILVRGRSHLKHIAEQLKNESVDFESVDITELQDHLLTRDLLSLTRALLHLGDKLAWLSVLRAPWCGLVLDDLLMLSEQDNQIIYEQLNNEAVLSKLSEDGQKRAKHLHYCLQDVVNNQGRFNFVELLTHAINQLGCTNKVLSEVELAIKNKFLKVIYDCEQQQLLNAETIESVMAKLYAPSDTAQVKLMTVHASKGLEFDTVIIPGLGRGSGKDSSPIVRLKEFSNNELLFAPIKSATTKDESGAYKYLKFIETEQNHFESMRLLYVAMTRAKSHLHLLGAVSKLGKIGKNTLLELLTPFFLHRFDDIDDTPDTVEQTEVLQLHRFAELKTPINQTPEKGETVEYQQNFERLFKSALGTLVHQYYEQQHFNPSVENIRNRLIEIGTAPSEVAHWQAVIVKLLDNTKNDTHFEWLFKNREMAQNEAEFIVNGKTIAIDRLFIDEGTLWVIDFKTAEPAEGESLGVFIKRQQTQHTKQLSFYKTVMSEIYDEPVRCALYCPSISQLIEID